MLTDLIYLPDLYMLALFYTRKNFKGIADCYFFDNVIFELKMYADILFPWWDKCDSDH